MAEPARPVYNELIDLIRQSAVAHADETGWRIGTLAAWLWLKMLWGALRGSASRWRVPEEPAPSLRSGQALSLPKGQAA